MKAIFRSFFLALIIASGSASATDPVYCLIDVMKVINLKDKMIEKKQAIRLCSGARDARVISCFERALETRYEGWLLTVDDAVNLCKTNSLQ